MLRLDEHDLLYCIHWLCFGTAICCEFIVKDVLRSKEWMKYCNYLERYSDFSFWLEKQIGIKLRKDMIYVTWRKGRPMSPVLTESAATDFSLEVIRTWSSRRLDSERSTTTWEGQPTNRCRLNRWDASNSQEIIETH